MNVTSLKDFKKCSVFGSGQNIMIIIMPSGAEEILYQVGELFGRSRFYTSLDGILYIHKLNLLEDISVNPFGDDINLFS